MQKLFIGHGILLMELASLIINGKGFGKVDSEGQRLSTQNVPFPMVKSREWGGIWLEINWVFTAHPWGGATDTSSSESIITGPVLRQPLFSPPRSLVLPYRLRPSVSRTMLVSPYGTRYLQMSPPCCIVTHGEDAFVSGLWPCRYFTCSRSFSELWSFCNVLIVSHSSGEMWDGRWSVWIENPGKSEAEKWELLFPLADHRALRIRKETLEMVS